MQKIFKSLFGLASFLAMEPNMVRLKFLSYMDFRHSTGFAISFSIEETSTLILQGLFATVILHSSPQNDLQAQEQYL